MNATVSYPTYTVYDLCEYFDDYMHEALQNVEALYGPVDAVKERMIAKDILMDFGTVPDGMSFGRYKTAVIVAVHNHWNI